VDPPLHQKMGELIDDLMRLSRVGVRRCICRTWISAPRRAPSLPICGDRARSAA